MPNSARRGYDDSAGQFADAGFAVRLHRDDLDALFPGLLESVLNGARHAYPAAGG
jgi:hypothetical protein